MAYIFHSNCNGNFVRDCHPSINLIRKKCLSLPKTSRTIRDFFRFHGLSYFGLKLSVCDICDLRTRKLKTNLKKARRWNTPGVLVRASWTYPPATPGCGHP